MCTSENGNTDLEVLAARSDPERHFYLMVRHCGHCGAGPFVFVEKKTSQLHGKNVDQWLVRCRQCRGQQQVLFDPDALLVDSATADRSLPVVNPGENPSRIIDLAQWMALFYAIIENASKQSDRIEARRLGYEAALCLEESLKFFQPDSDLPPQDAFFSDQTLGSFRGHPENFTRQHLLQLRDKLPSISRMENVIQRKDKPPRPSRWQAFKDKLKLFGRW